MLATYTGHEPLTFQDYIDMATGRTLSAKPGEVYDVAPASGHPVPDLPAGWFTPLEGQERTEEDAPPAEEPQPEPVAEPEGEQPQQVDETPTY